MCVRVDVCVGGVECVSTQGPQNVGACGCVCGGRGVLSVCQHKGITHVCQLPSLCASVCSVFGIRDVFDVCK